MEASKHIVSSHCESFKKNRKRDLKGFLLINIIGRGVRGEFIKTCSAMNCQNSEESSEEKAMWLLAQA